MSAELRRVFLIKWKQQSNNNKGIIFHVFCCVILLAERSDLSIIGFNTALKSPAIVSSEVGRLLSEEKLYEAPSCQDHCNVDTINWPSGSKTL